MFSGAHSMTSNYPTHSNPNLPHFPCSASQTRKQSLVEHALARSSSQPPDMFCWDDSPIHQPNLQFNLRNHLLHLKTFESSDVDTQTDSCLDIPSKSTIEQYVLQNPRHILELLGLNPDQLSQQNYLSKIVPEITRTSPILSNNSFINNNDVELGIVDEELVPKRNSMIDWNQWSTNHIQHRYSAGDAENTFKTENKIPSTHSMKFQPSEPNS